MIIDCIADLHGFYHELEGGDLLIVAGDLTRRDTEEEYRAFNAWLKLQPYIEKIIIGGNHDNLLYEKYNGQRIDHHLLPSVRYLQDSGTEFESLKIWGTPWTKTFEGMNPHCKAFTLDTEEELAKKWKLIPDDIDILITHSPPYGIGDMIDDQYHCGNYHVGSKSLTSRLRKETKIRLHVFGHIHEGYCHENLKRPDGSQIDVINASHVNEYYEPVNKPRRVIL